MNKLTSVNELLEGFAKPQPDDAMIAGFKLDSRDINQGEAFVALKGTKEHGINFAGQAIANGTRAIIYEDTKDIKLDAAKVVPLFPVKNLGKKISKVAARFYENPSEKLKVFAVTGTNGKSSIAYGLGGLLGNMGHKVLVVGTVGVMLDGILKFSSHTTPDAISLQTLIKTAVDAGAEFLVMEASSHGLAQYRLDGVKVDTAIFTNLSRDHQDYHPDMQRYAAAKERLFQMPTVKSALINVTDDFGKKLATKYKDKLKIVSYGIDIVTKTQNYLNAYDVKLTKGGISFSLGSSWGQGEVMLKQFGKFNVENILVIIGSCLLLGMNLPAIIKSLGTIKLVPGRMQSISCKNRPLVVVDYAHTPDALEKALKALREHIGNVAKIICVFGCGGDRDQGKRPLMGRTVEDFADMAIITDDNPRDEDSGTIIKQILTGFKYPEKPMIIPDRKQAIESAIKSAGIDDVILVAGKGHETVQIIGKKSFEFNDAKVVELALC